MLGPVSESTSPLFLLPFTEFHIITGLIFNFSFLLDMIQQ